MVDRNSHRDHSSQDNTPRMDRPTPNPETGEQRIERVNGDPFAWCNQLLRTLCELRRELEVHEVMPENLSGFDQYMMAMLESTSGLVSSTLDLRNDLVVALHTGELQSGSPPIFGRVESEVIVRRAVLLGEDPVAWIDSVLHRACEIQADAEAIVDPKLGVHQPTIRDGAGDLVSHVLDFYNNLIIEVYEVRTASYCYPVAKGGAA